MLDPDASRRALEQFFTRQPVADLTELGRVLGTESRVSVFRPLATLGCRRSRGSAAVRPRSRGRQPAVQVHVSTAQREIEPPRISEVVYTKEHVARGTQNNYGDIAGQADATGEFASRASGTLEEAEAR